MTAPSDAATYERARRLANIAVWTIALQCRRLRMEEPEDGEFLFRRWADFQFLIVALTRCRRAAMLAAKVHPIAGQMRVAIGEFDRAIPGLKAMRDVSEHIDDYAFDQGRNTSVERHMLEVGVVGGSALQWLKWRLDADEALAAARVLFSSIQAAGSSVGHDRLS